MNANALPQSRWAYSGASGATIAVTALGYDSVGDLTSVTGPRTDVTQVTNYVWDYDRELTMAIAPATTTGASPPRVATQLTYDTGGRLANVEKGTTTTSTGSDFSAQEETTYAYDGADRLNLTAVLNAAGGTAISITQNSYYPNGLLECTAVRMNPSVYGSSPYSSLPAACTASTTGAYGPDIISQAAYEATDLASVQTGVGTSLVQTTATLTYTPDDLIASYKDARGNMVSFAYDGFDRLSTTTYPGGSTEQNQYDPNGNLTIWTNRGGYGVVRCYDTLNRKVSEAGITGAANAAPTADGSCPTGGTANTGFTFGSRTFGYDLMSRLTSANSSTSGWTEAWVYDAWNNLDSFTTPLGTYGQVHDLAGNLTQLTGPDGYVVGYAYDAMNRMIKATYKPPGGTAGTVASLTYDSLGRRSAVSYGDTSTATWSWDAADRLTALAHAFPASASDVTLSYGYDPAFRAASRTLSNGAYANGGPFGATSYGTANSLNQYPSVNGHTFSWLAQGPLQTDQTQGYGYDEASHLVDSNKTASPATSVYTPADPLGLTYARETSNLAPNTLTYYSGNGQSASNAMERVYAYTGGAWTWQGDRPLIQGPGPDEFLGYVDTSGAVYYPHTDETGSAIALSRGTGAPTVFSYDPFGVSASPIYDQPTGALTYAYRYTGQRLDPLSGVYDYKARAYEPGLGRFLQTDPAGLSAGPNLYAYLANNPVGGRDPTGMDGDNYCIGQQPGNGACAPIGDIFAAANPPTPVSELVVYGGCNWLCLVNRLVIQQAVQLFTPSPVYYCTMCTGGPAGSAIGGSSSANAALQSNACTATPSLGLHGVGVVGGIEGSAGVVAAGATAQGQAGAMVFAGRGGLNAGGFASGVAAAYAGSRMAAAPAQSGSSWILGAYAGLGGGFTFTNATNVQQLSGPFATTSVSLPFASGSLSQGGGIWQLSVTFGPGAIAAATQTTSNTATTKVYGHC